MHAIASAVPASRVHVVGGAPVRGDGAFVLYWMVGSRRLGWNYGLQRAVDWCRALQRPLLILEPLRSDHPWASVRFHTFVVQGMADNAARAAAANVTYLPYVETRPGEGRGLLDALATSAAVVVTDDVPWFFLPRMVAAAGRRLSVRLEAVDSLGWMPFRTPETEFGTAHAFRRYLQRNLLPHLSERPVPDPLTGPGLSGAVVPEGVRSRWPSATPALLAGAGIESLGVDTAVRAVAARGGTRAGRERLQRFLDTGLDRYPDRSSPDAHATSGLSPYLHWGHVSSHEVVDAVLAREGWSPDRLGSERSGSREGFWGVSEAAQAFLDQVVTWRELGSNLCVQRPDHASPTVLPAWALETLRKHQGDPRPHRFDVATLERAQTPDPVWNAAQRELMATGVIHNAVRMVWGKRVLEWTGSPEEAFQTLVHLNDRWALDGRDGNSYTAISWVLGRYDRPWGPVRPIFGTIRYMSSDNSVKKWPMKQYLQRWSSPSLWG
jgi:deoxyribodipyrimidine photo-lyase